MNNPQKSSSIDAAWRRFQSTMDDIKKTLESTPRFMKTPQHRAKAYQSLLEAQAMAYNQAVGPRLRYPHVQTNTAWMRDFLTLGQNCPDFHYSILVVNGRQTYRVRGNFGDLAFIIIQVQDGTPSSTGKTKGSYDISREGFIDKQGFGVPQFRVESDGSFEAILSAKRVDTNWIQLDDKCPLQYLFIRSAMFDTNDDPGWLRVERVNELPDDYYDFEEFDEEYTAGRIIAAADFAKYLLVDWGVGLYDQYLRAAGGVTNRLGLLPGLASSEVASPLCAYAVGIFELRDDDDALIFEMADIPDGLYWSFQLGDVWSRALNMTDHQTSINCKQAAIDSDGVFRAVVSRRDPGVANWIETTGRVEGTIVFRNYRATFQTVPQVRLAKFSELQALLPRDVSRVNSETRKMRIARRREGFLKIHGE